MLEIGLSKSEGRFLVIKPIEVSKEDLESPREFLKSSKNYLDYLNNRLFLVKRISFCVSSLCSFFCKQNIIVILFIVKFSKDSRL
jgi:hypothetical protein